MSSLKNKRIVIKLGSSTLTNGSKNLDRAHMLEIVRTVHKLKEQGAEVILVSSGAIAAGREFFFSIIIFNFIIISLSHFYTSILVINIE